jgi:hypothetical protein
LANHKDGEQHVRTSCINGTTARQPRRLHAQDRVGNPPAASQISLWDSKESAENYNRASFGEVTKLLSKLVEGTPRVKSYEVANSTFHKIAATQKAA